MRTTTGFITSPDNLTSELSEENTTSININKCLEIAAIRIMKKEKGSWSLKKTPNPATELLYKLRQQIIKHMQNNPKLSVFDTIKNKCSTSNNSYRLFIEVTAYKKPGKVLPKTGQGKEKLSIITSLIRKKTNKTIAQKRLVGRDVTAQLTINKSEFMTAIAAFLKSGIE
jgi:hypothetical protein